MMLGTCVTTFSRTCTPSTGQINFGKFRVCPGWEVDWELVSLIASCSLLFQLVNSFAFIVTAPTHHSSASSTC